MNYLELCQRVRLECAISGSGPAAVTGQVGVYSKLVNWVNDAWREIQLDKTQWLFMWGEFTFDTIINTPDTTTTGLTVRDFTREPLVIYHKATGLDDKGFIPYLKYKDWYARYGASHVPAGRPQVWTVLPNGALRLTPKPDGEYVVIGNGHLKPQTLINNADIPILPEEYHLAIMWLACSKWFADQEAGQRQQDMMNNYLSIKDELLRDQLPTMDWGYQPLS